MSRKFLDDLGVDPKSYEVDDRPEEIGTYGFSSEETWSLDATSAYWLYEHLMMFNKVKNFDSNRGYFDVKIVDEDSVETLDKIKERYILHKRLCNSKMFYVCKFKDVTLNLQECIDVVIEYLKDYIVFFESENKNPFSFSEHTRILEEIFKEKLSCAFKIYGTIINCIWW